MDAGVASISTVIPAVFSGDPPWKAPNLDSRVLPTHAGAGNGQQT